MSSLAFFLMVLHTYTPFIVVSSSGLVLVTISSISLAITDIEDIVTNTSPDDDTTINGVYVELCKKTSKSLRKVRRTQKLGQDRLITRPDK